MHDPFTWYKIKHAGTQVRPRLQYTRKIWKRSFISTVRPTIHTNLSRKRIFKKTLFKPEEFENDGFSFSCGRKTFWNEDDDDVTIIMWFPWQSFPQTTVNRGDWVWSPENIKGANKDDKIYVGRSTTMHNLLFCAHTLCMNYVIITNTFLLVSSSLRSKQLLCFVHGQGQKANKNIQQRALTSFITIPLY